MGHEYVGIVEEVGAEVTGIKPGQFVTGSFFASDNTCEICRTGFHTSCRHREFVGAGARETSCAGKDALPASNAGKASFPASGAQPSTRCEVQNDVRSVEPAAACAAALNSATVDTPYQCDCAYDLSRLVIAVSPISRRRSCSVHLP